MRQVFADIGERIDDVLTIALGGDVEIAAAHRLEPRTGRQHPLGYVQSDLAPLVDDPDPIVFIGLIDIAVQQFELEPLGSGLFQQAPRLGPRLFDVGPIAGDLLQLFLGRGERRVWESDATDGVHDRDLGQLRCAAPTVDGQGQRAPYADVVERFALVVRGYPPATVPVAGLDGNLVAERLFQLVDSGRWKAAKFDCSPVRADRLDADRLLVGIYPGKAVEVRQPRTEVVGVALTLDRLAGIVADELERARAEDVLFVPVRVLVEDFLFIDPGIGVGQRRQKRVGGELQPENHGGRIGGLDFVHHDEVTLSGADDALRREDDLIPARRDILRRQWRAVGEFDLFADLEGVGHAVVGRLRHRRAQIADEIVGLAR